MNRPSEISINQFQLAILLNDEEKAVYKDILTKGVVCVHCGGLATHGIHVENIYLTQLNDIKIGGKCNVCNGKVARIIEFAENIEFYDKVMKFRKSIG